jgi:hypothetical protein
LSVSLIPAINLLPVTTTSVIRVCGELSAASGAYNQGVWGVYGCVFSWWFQ